MSLAYYDSAEDVFIGRNRALLELAKHNITSHEAIAEFDEYMGGLKDEYHAQEILEWLGY